MLAHTVLPLLFNIIVPFLATHLVYTHDIDSLKSLTIFLDNKFYCPRQPPTWARLPSTATCPNLPPLMYASKKRPGRPAIAIKTKLTGPTAHCLLPWRFRLHRIRT